jgi:hypothetical protein
MGAAKTAAVKAAAMKATAAKTTAMAATAVAAAVTTTMAAAASRDGVSGRRQRGRENNDGNSQSELRHGTPHYRFATNVTAPR